MPSNKSHDQALIVFLKEPVPGKVKTRLAAYIGNQKAVDVYSALLNHTVEVARSSQADTLAFHADFDNPETSFRSKFKYWESQEGGDLGARMSNAMRWAFKKGYKKAVLIGTDCPGLSYNHLKNAFDLLENKPVCLGPASDGGYYLIGLSAYIPDLFSGIEWSTETVLEESIKRIANLKRNYGLLEELTDIDNLSDLEQFPTYAQIAGLKS